MEMPFFLQALIKRHYIHEPFWTLWKYLENIEKNVNILFPEGIFRTERWNEFLTQASTSLAEMKSAITETSRALPDNSLTAETKIACSLLLKNMNMILASLQNLKKEDGKRIQKKDISFEKFQRELLFASVQLNKTEAAIKRCMQNKNKVQMQRVVTH